jgi:hypothetical protein
MPRKTDKSKAKPTFFAQLVLRVMRDDGITKTSEIADAIGACARSVRKAKAELLFLGTSIPGGTLIPEQECRSGTSVPTAPRVRAYNESSSKIVLEERKKERKKETPIPPKPQIRRDCQEAFDLFHTTASRCGLSVPNKLTNDRSRKLKQRLDEYGIDGWKQALANIERSSFLTGENQRGWKASFDFLLQPASFSKVHDGAYGNGRHAETSKPPAYQASLEKLKAEFAAEGVFFDD